MGFRKYPVLAHSVQEQDSTIFVMSSWRDGRDDQQKHNPWDEFQNKSALFIVCNDNPEAQMNNGIIYTCINKTFDRGHLLFYKCSKFSMLVQIIYKM